MRYTDAEKDAARALCVEIGLGEAHDKLGIPKATLSRWLTPEQAAEMHQRFHHKTSRATEVHALSMEAKKRAFAEALMGDLKKLRSQLFAPCVEDKVVTLAGAHGQSATWDIVEVHRDKPTFADQVKILTSIGIAVDKVQILTGEATDRIDITGDVRARATELADELAQRRATKAA